MSGYYRDFREYLAALEERGQLHRVKREINKDTELIPMVRWQFRGLPEHERKAFLFENVVDIKGRKYDVPVAVAAHAASRQVYATAMKCKPEEIFEKWTQAQRNPLPPRLVGSGPVHEVVHTGADLNKPGGGMELFPIPISTPGFDNAPYLTAANWITKDPETGIRNMGNYRAQIKGRARTGVCILYYQHIGIHWQKYRNLRRPMEAAIVIGAAPSVGLSAVAKVPYGLDELAIAGAVGGEPLDVVKCKTVDLEVPASAEIVIEGIIGTDWLEPEAPFGEYTGYMGIKEVHPWFEITAITHRRNPIYTAFISQFPPSESSKLKQMSFEPSYYRFLRYDCNNPAVQDVAFHEISGSTWYCVIKMKKAHPAQPKQALNAAAAFDPGMCKVIITVDDDIDPRDPESVNWALSFRMQPHRDISITTGKVSGLDPSAAPPWASREEAMFPQPEGTSAILIDATRKWDYPPVALPKREYMERAKQLWEEEGLPTLTPRTPWHGYNLGFWTPEYEEEAQLALQGEHYQTADKAATQRVKPTDPETTHA